MGAWRDQLFRRPAWRFAGLLGVALVLLLVFWPGGDRLSIRLSDGSQLTFHGFSVGLNCSRYYGSFFGRLAQSLPVGVQRVLPQGMWVRYGYAETNLVFWLRQDQISSVPPADSRIRFSLADDQGASVAVQVSPSVQPLPDGGRAITLPESVWPRTARKMVLSVFDEGLETPTQLAGQWIIENLEPGGRAPRPVQSLPVSQRIGDVIVTLEQFDVRPMPVMLWRLSRTNVFEPLGFLVFSCTNAAGSEATAPWRLAAVRLRDATGNSRGWKPVGPDSDTARAGRTAVSMVKIPWPGETFYDVETLWRPSNPGMETGSGTVDARALKSVIFVVRPERRTNSLRTPSPHISR